MCECVRCMTSDGIESHVYILIPHLGTRLAVFTGHKKYLRHFVNKTGFARLKMMNIYSYSFSHEIYKLLDAIGFSYKTIIEIQMKSYIYYTHNCCLSM